MENSETQGSNHRKYPDSQVLRNPTLLDETKRVHNFVSWLHSNGVFDFGCRTFYETGSKQEAILNIQVERDKSTAQFQRKVVAARDLKAGSVLARIPFDLALWASHQDSDRLEVSANVLLARRLLEECLRLDSSRWRSYILALPVHIDSTILTISEDEIENIEFPYEKWRSLERAKSLKKLVIESRHLCDLPCSTFLKRWALSNCISRPHGVILRANASSEPNFTALVPGLDMFNHADIGSPMETASWYVDLFNQEFVIYSMRSIQHAEEICIAYGSHSSDEWLLNYGFVLDSKYENAILFEDIKDFADWYITCFGDTICERYGCTTERISCDINEVTGMDGGDDDEEIRISRTNITDILITALSACNDRYPNAAPTIYEALELRCFQLLQLCPHSILDDLALACQYEPDRFQPMLNSYTEKLRDAIGDEFEHGLKPSEPLTPVAMQIVIARLWKKKLLWDFCLGESKIDWNRPSVKKRRIPS